LCYCVCFKGWLRVYYGLDLLLSKLSKVSETVPPLVSLLPISRSAGRPLSIKNKSRRSEHQLYSGLCYCTAYSRPFSSFIPGVTVHLYSQQFSFIPRHVTVQLYSWPCYCSALFPAISSFIPDCVPLLDTCGSLP
jgi:hypothetical protein